MEEVGGSVCAVVWAKGHTTEHPATTLVEDGLELLERVALVDGISEVHDAALVVEHRQLLQPAGPPRALTDKDRTVGPGPDDNQIGGTQCLVVHRRRRARPCVPPCPVPGGADPH